MINNYFQIKLLNASKLPKLCCTEKIMHHDFACQICWYTAPIYKKNSPCANLADETWYLICTAANSVLGWNKKASSCSALVVKEVRLVCDLRARWGKCLYAWCTDFQAQDFIIRQKDKALKPFHCNADQHWHLYIKLLIAQRVVWLRQILYAINY